MNCNGLVHFHFLIEFEIEMSAPLVIVDDAMINAPQVEVQEEEKPASPSSAGRLRVRRAPTEATLKKTEICKNYFSSGYCAFVRLSSFFGCRLTSCVHREMIASLLMESKRFRNELDLLTSELKCASRWLEVRDAAILLTVTDAVSLTQEMG
jgi:hypothetical protein